MKTLLESLLDDEDVIINKFDRKKEIKKWLKENCEISGTYKINNNIVDIKGSIYITNDELLSFPIDLFKFGVVSDVFVCSGCDKLVSLEGSPEKCRKFFCVGCHSLKTLKGAPKNCDIFNCVDCRQIQSLEFSPECKQIQCDGAGIKTLKGISKTCEQLLCISCSNLLNIKDLQNTKCTKINISYCDSLTSLEGSPIKCIEFYCEDCYKLKTLKGAPKECKLFHCDECEELKTLKGAPEICDTFSCNSCPLIKSLDGAPINCRYFSCDDCGIKFTKEEINQHLLK